MHRGRVVKGRKPGTIATGSHTLEKTPPAPPGLSADARAAWKRAARILVERRHLTAADLGTLESYCIAIAMRDEAARAIAATGATYKSGDLIKAHPACGVLRDALSASLRHAAELGLTIVSRSRITVNDGPEELDFLG